MDGDLRSALRALWNVLGALRHDGSVALLAECTDGLGSPAVKEFVAGRLQPAQALRQRRYVDGLEDLVYLETARQRHDLILASTVPLHYAHEKLGFRVARKANHALELLLGKQGARAKVHLVPQASRSLLRTE
jgi:nickel-dependent lactate racemase